MSNQQKINADFENILRGTMLVSPTAEEFDLLLKRLRQQLGEGRGEVILEVNIAL